MKKCIRRWRGAIEGGGERSQVEGRYRWWRGAIAGGGERSQERGYSHVEVEGRERFFWNRSPLLVVIRKHSNLNLPAIARSTCNSSPPPAITPSTTFVIAPLNLGTSQPANVFLNQ